MSNSINIHRAIRQALTGWSLAGVTHLPRPPARAAPAPSAAVPPAAAVSQTPAPVEPQLAVQPTPRDDMKKSPIPEDRAAQLQVLQQRVARCTRCAELARTRTQTVFGVGDPNARVMFIGEAPGADEDAQGIPFVGKAGQLLTKIIEACGWKREELYICNILRCRPPGNRTPTKEEADNCREFLDGQIAIVDPEYIVCWGSCAAQNLLRTNESIGKMRGRFFTYGRAKVLCTYHPSYLLRNPEAKRPVWEDMKFLLSAMGLTPPAG